jgi:hypothetical protein
MHQAEYYTTVLDEHRVRLEAELAHHCVALAEHQENGDSPGMRRLRQVIGHKRREQFELDCLLQALTDRFFPSRATQTGPVRCFAIHITPQARCWTVHIPQIDGRIKAPSLGDAEMTAREHIAVSIGAPIAEIAVHLVTGS